MHESGESCAVEVRNRSARPRQLVAERIGPVAPLPPEDPESALAAFTVPGVAEAMDDIAWASWLYAAYPQVKGAAIWYLGYGFGGIADQAQRLIAPLTEYALTHYYIVEQGQGAVDPELFRP